MRKTFEPIWPVLLLLLFVSNSYGNSSNDSIPPNFISFPQDTFVNCEDNISFYLNSWLVNAAGARWDDSTATLETTIDQQLALDSLTNGSISCTIDRILQIGFFAIDSCQNNSDTLFAHFVVQDLEVPIIDIPNPNIIVPCDALVQDTLSNWLQSFGNAVISDNCNEVNKTNIVWQDNQGNSGFFDYENIEEISIARDSCEWELEVLFFVEDECGNINNSEAMFSIQKDTIAPVIIFAPRDTIIQCSANTDTINPTIVDVCDNIIDLEFREIVNRSTDSTSCAFYNYTIERIWNASDICLNQFEYRQTIEIVDTIGPSAQLENIVARDCDEPLNNPQEFLSNISDCSTVEINFRDSLTNNFVCQNQFVRTWILSDLCNNTTELKQTFQIQDFSSPEFTSMPNDTMVGCGTNQLDSIFNAWINSLTSIQLNDNCNTSFLRISSTPDLTDTMAILESGPPILNNIKCNNNNDPDIVLEQTVYLYAYDLCENINQASVVFAIIDTIAPEIFDCPSNLEVFLNEEECDINLIINTPSVNDQCLPDDQQFWSLKLDEQFNFDSIQVSANINLDIGNHTITYEVGDCAQNTSSCIQQITIRDTFPPELECPPTINAFLNIDNCEAEIIIPDLVDFDDNCFGEADYSETLPLGEGFINFVFDSTTNLYKADNFPVQFNNVRSGGILFKPSLTVDYAINIDPGSKVVIRSESGDNIFEISENACTNRSEKILLDPIQFDTWQSDEQVTFSVLFLDDMGIGITPCIRENVMGEFDIDDFSFLKLTLEYSDVNAELSLFENDSLIANNISNISLETGSYNIIYNAIDLEGNLGMCTTQVEVRDTTVPIIACSDVEWRINLDTILNYEFTLTDLNVFISDNCEISDTSIFPTEFTCLDVGKTIPVNIQVLDENQNFNTCSTDVLIVGDSLRPTFISGLCFADSLKLFSNINDIENNFQYEWSGPQNFSSRESNPVITNINASNSGEYQLMVTNEFGCQFEGNVSVIISQFTSPEINTTNNNYCVGDEIVLNTTSFTEEVDYFWYEGISPNGILIDQTDGPSLNVTPPLGQHFYYVEVKGEECNSNPSITIEINMLPIPEASIDDPFTTICIGDEITLSTSVIQNDYTYNWTGPDGYNSTEQIPEVISNAQSENAGIYSLIINNPACSSDPALAEVIIFDPPPQPTINGNNLFCEGQSAVLSVSNISSATRYHWILNGQLFTSSSDNNLLIPSIQNSQSGDWSVVVEDAICFSDTSEVFEVVVEPKLNIGASNNGPFCEGDSVQLTVSFIPNATYLWEGPQGNTFNTREVETLAFDGIYSVTVTTESNCTNVTTTAVTVGFRPNITALSNTSLECMNEGETITFVPTVFPLGNYNYEWSGPEGFFSNEEQPQLVINSLNNNGDYQLIVTEDNCDSNPVITNVEFILTPNKALIKSEENFCPGDTLLIEVVNPNPNSNLWLWSTPLGTISTSFPFLQIPNFDTNLIGAYSVIEAIDECRAIESDEINIGIQIKPDTPEINAESTCIGSNVFLNASSESNAEYIWITPRGELTTNVNDLEITEITELDKGPYSVIISKSNCVSDTSELFFIDLIQKPVVPNILQTEFEFCNQNNEENEICIDNLSANFDSLLVYNIITDEKLFATSENCFSIADVADEASRIELFLRFSLDGCESNSSVPITINLSDIPNEFNEFMSDTLYSCNEPFITLNPDFIFENTSIEWSSPDPELLFTSQNQANISVSNLRVGPNTFFISSSFESCNNYMIDTLVVIVQTELQANDDFVESGYNESIIFNPLLNDVTQGSVFYNSVSSDATDNITEDNNSLIITPGSQLIGEITVEYEICHISCPSICDKAVITINIDDVDNCFAGNIITPNEDGYNDVLFFPCLQNNSENSSQLEIYNQWGDLVFKSTPYQNDWAGTFKNQKLPSGTYYFIFKFNDDASPIQDFVIIEK